MVFGVGVMETGNDRIDEVFDVDEAALVIDGTEGEGEIGIEEFDEAFHVAGVARAVD